jgi:hypothetical protein
MCERPQINNDDWRELGGSSQLIILGKMHHEVAGIGFKCFAKENILNFIDYGRILKKMTWEPINWKQRTVGIW